MWAIRVLAFAAGCGTLLAQPAGDPANGKLIFEGKGACTGCHRINGSGNHFGPDLSEIGARRPDQLQASILDPDAEILPANRIYRVVAKNGTVTIGRLLNEDTFTVQMIDKMERLLSFQKADLKEYAFETKSPMPSFKDRLSAQEVADVVAYLGTFKPAPGAGRGGRGGAPAAVVRPRRWRIDRWYGPLSPAKPNKPTQDDKAAAAGSQITSASAVTRPGRLAIGR